MKKPSVLYSTNRPACNKKWQLINLDTWSVMSYLVSPEKRVQLLTYHPDSTVVITTLQIWSIRCHACPMTVKLIRIDLVNILEIKLTESRFQIPLLEKKPTNSKIHFFQ